MEAIENKMQKDTIEEAKLSVEEGGANKTLQAESTEKEVDMLMPIEKKMLKISLDDEEQASGESVSNNASNQKECAKNVIITPMAVEDILNKCDPKKVEDVIKFYMSVLTTQYEKNGKKPIPYYRYIVDTSDYDKTKNNMFNTSIIINRGMARLAIDEKKRAILSPAEKEEIIQFKAKGGKTTSLIMSITYEQWEKFKITANGSEGYLQEAIKQKVNP